MKTTFFLPYHSHSHINGSFNISALLKSSHYHIIYLVYDVSKKYLQQQGFKSFGSILSVENLILKTFLKKLFQICEGLTNIILVVSGFKNDTFIGYQNIFLFEFIPQLYFLENHCDIFITHAGLNSVKEGIVSNVPMLAYPTKVQPDGNGNAAKIEYHGLGLRGDIERDTQEQIETKINELLHDPKYKQNIAAMKGRIANNPAYKPENILQIIEKLPYLE